VKTADAPEAVTDLPESLNRHRPAVAWGPVTLTVDEESLTAILRRFSRDLPEIDDIFVRIASGELSVTIVVRRFGVRIPARARLSELRFREGFLAFVLESVDALSFIPIPDAVVARFVDRAPAGLLTFYPRDRILVLRLNDWIPAGLDVSFDRAEFVAREARFHFAPGRLDLAPMLAPDEE
jgi:hypothetical protein